MYLAVDYFRLIKTTTKRGQVLLLATRDSLVFAENKSMVIFSSKKGFLNSSKTQTRHKAKLANEKENILLHS